MLAGGSVREGNPREGKEQQEGSATHNNTTMKQQKHEGTAYNLANVLSALGQVPADAHAPTRWAWRRGE
jgi:hypothetical protein